MVQLQAISSIYSRPTGIYTVLVVPEKYGKVMGVMGLALLAAEIGDSWASNSGVQSLRPGMGLTSAQACPLPVASDNGSEGIAIHAISIYSKL